MPSSAGKKKRRTLAFGIVSAAGSVGTMVTAPIAAYFLDHQGWRAGRWAFLILALAMLPAAFVGSRADRLPNGVAGDRNLSLGGSLGDGRLHSCPPRRSSALGGRGPPRARHRSCWAPAC